LIQDMQPYQPATQDYLSGAVQTLTYQDKLYGLPLSLRPMALYYNTQLVSAPAATLDEWLDQAANGASVALNTNFRPAFWGIQAFGGQAFDEQRRVILDQGGFANWLNWLRNAQDAPGMILSRDEASLRDLFFTGKAAYYTGSPDDLVDAKAALGIDNVAVSVLPAGPIGPSGPLLDVEAIYFNHASAPTQTETAVLLAQFLTNASQSSTMMREIGRVPANRTVKVDPRLNPAVAGFAAQARTAVPVPNIPPMETLVALGDDIYKAVLEGVLEPAEATVLLTGQVNDAYGFATVETAPNNCQASGVLRIWHPWTGRQAQAIDKFAADFAASCANATVLTTQVSERELFDLYTAGRVDEGRYTLPDLILGPSTWLVPFGQAESIQPITDNVTTETRQRFIPAALNTLAIDNNLYGLPLWMQFETLYYNSSLVNDPPASLDELLQQTTADKSAALPTNFIESYWGARAYGAQLFTEEYRLDLADTGFVDWLTWLLQAQKEPGIFLDENSVLLQTTFYSGGAAFLVGPTSALGNLERAMDGDQLRAAKLPAGPNGEAAPWLQTAAFFVTAGISEEQRNLALDFMEFATNRANQTYLMSEARMPPVNINVSTENDPVMAVFVQNVASAFVPPNVPQIMAVLDNGDQVYPACFLRPPRIPYGGVRFHRTG
ncbi:MAG: extracellular solute-binding protein, partial [Ardenticatenaceae bacterium]|nr:extracellular solute-binding protein [Ardenticatenaceae bacterium]